MPHYLFERVQQFDTKNNNIKRDFNQIGSLLHLIVVIYPCAVLFLRCVAVGSLSHYLQFKEPPEDGSKSPLVSLKSSLGIMSIVNAFTSDDSVCILVALHCSLPSREMLFKD